MESVNRPSGDMKKVKQPRLVITGTARKHM